ncbi:MAG: hypothetical protein ABH885_06315 [Candidatus Omnitrophota bacterium]
MLARMIFVFIIVFAFAVLPAMAEDFTKESEEAISEMTNDPPPDDFGDDMWPGAEEDTVAAAAVDDQGDVVAVAETQYVLPEGAFLVFTERWSTEDHYTPSGWMGDYGDISIDDNCTADPHSGKTCLEITYTAEASQGAGWMGIFWQNPPNNWGDQMGGYDLTGYKKATFWARGGKGGEVISEFKVGGITGMYTDSDSTGIDNIVLTKDWKQYEISLEGLDLSYISGGFCLTASSVDNPAGFTIYIDDVMFEK